MGGRDAESGGSVAEQHAAGAGGPAGGTDGEAGADDPGRRYTRQPVRRRPLGCLIEIAETLLLTILIFWLIQTFVAQPFQVQQESMSGTLEEGQYVLVDKLSPHFDSYSRGDIVVFLRTEHDGACSTPGVATEDTPFIKRVIGEPGDVVRVSDGEVFVNDAQLSEPYINSRGTSGEDSWTVGAGELFVMGDNRPNSSDSRQFGPICASDVVGRAFLRYWPLNTLGILQTPTYANVPPPPTAAP